MRADGKKPPTLYSQNRSQQEGETGPSTKSLTGIPYLEEVGDFQGPAVTLLDLVYMIPGARAMGSDPTDQQNQ
ncbi:hypothetical protein A7C99_4452 [Trichophyton rubrum]|uniref:Uncharacterized protein n=1 Tax=Trichophyton rubrum TaxID=5551 RepID=A0A178EWD3_TRIRU|nr:hypothetical protein HL42_6414 [Trichophyton rubrum]OAL64382.1 hypothetical protein A7C99_4452 [Trichophyton rubrum]